jgi:hypothetical protein
MCPGIEERIFRRFLSSRARSISTQQRAFVFVATEFDYRTRRPQRGRNIAKRVPDRTDSKCGDKREDVRPPEPRSGRYKRARGEDAFRGQAPGGNRVSFQALKGRHIRLARTMSPIQSLEKRKGCVVDSQGSASLHRWAVAYRPVGASRQQLHSPHFESDPSRTGAPYLAAARVRRSLIASPIPPAGAFSMKISS